MDFMLRVIATLRVYNEADILTQVLDHLYEHGILFVIVDSGSQDKSREIALSYKDRGLLEHIVVRMDTWKASDALDTSLELAYKYSPDWILRNDADEFLEPTSVTATLFEAIAADDARGVNLIQFDNFEFCVTEKDYNSTERDIRKKLRYYTWNDDYRYKAWKYYPGITDRDSGGHYPRFPSGIEPKIGPQKYVMRHYRFRTPEQAVRRVFKERLPRYDLEERARGWHWHYDHFKEDPNFFILDSKILSRYDNDGKWDLTKRFDWYNNWQPPTRGQLFGLCTNFSVVGSSGELGDLIALYDFRYDLQAAFPEVKQGNYRNLVDWGWRVVNRQVNDSAYDQLAPFGYWYALMMVYDSRPDLQTAFPNAYTSPAVYHDLLCWANGVADRRWQDSAYATLEPYAGSYKTKS
jgi:glycosyltransferase involved in cell wall biosynthesis